MRIRIFYDGLPAVAALLILLPGVAPVQAADGATTLAPVTVVAAPVDEAQDVPLTGKSTLTAEQMKALPARNGSLNELLTVMPGVQAGEMTNTSLQGGEILPPNLSISGGRFYDNNFMIDGVGNNSLLDPAGNNPEHSQNIPGHPQELFVDPALLGEINVYRYNIPAEYGGFTGGVVDAVTRDPAKTFGGTVDLRTTRASWTRFHLDDEYEDTFKFSNSANQQPRFSKYHGGAELDIPLGEEMGLLVSYRNLQSRIPLKHFGETQDQNRNEKNYFAKYIHDVSDRTVVKLTFLQTTFDEERFRELTGGSEVKDSWYIIERNGYRLNAEVSHEVSVGTLELIAGYLSSENNRNAPLNYFSWKARPKGWNGDWDKDWGAIGKFSYEGGYGDLKSTQETETLAVNFMPILLHAGPVSHETKLGYGFERVTGSFERSNPTYVYINAYPKVPVDVVCGGDVIDCVDGQQFMTQRNYYAPDSVNETINKHFAYIQNSMKFKRLTIIPGYRVSRDNFMDNIDHDFRLASFADIFGSGKTIIFGGLNRYHGKQLLTYKLDEAKKSAVSERIGYCTEYDDKDKCKISSWKYLDAGNRRLDWNLQPSVRSITKYSELDTPYSDEWIVGITQELFGGHLKIDYLERRNKKEFATEVNKVSDQGPIFSTLNNNGRTLHEAVTVEWDRAWSRHYLNLNATWQQTETSHDNYRLALEEDDLLDQVYYHGRLMKRIDLPRDDYNRGYIGNLIYRVALPYGFSFTNHTRYRSGFEALEDTDEEAEGPDGEPIAVYAKEKQPESWIFNWRLDWRRNLYRNHGLQLSLEVNNVFNQKVPAGAEEEIQTYELGRQFWAGMEYYF